MEAAIMKVDKKVEKEDKSSETGFLDDDDEFESWNEGSKSLSEHKLSFRKFKKI